MSADTLPRHAAATYVEGIHTSDAMRLNNESDQDAGLVVDPGPGTRAVDAGDIGKIAVRVDTGSAWRLKSVTPSVVWTSVDGAWNKRAFAAALSFDVPGVSRTPEHTVTGALAFSRVTTGAIPGAALYCRVRANGVNVPTFGTGLVEHRSSDAYDNTDGALNVLHALYDGTTYWYAWSGEAVAVPVDTTAPTITARTITGAGTTLVLTASEALDPLFAPSSAFALAMSGGAVTVTGATISGLTISCPLSRTIAEGETGTCSYTQPGSGGVRDGVGNLLATFSGAAVVNNASGLYVRLTAVGAGYTETGNSASGYTYTRTTSGSFNTAGGASKSLPALADGYIECEATNIGGADAYPVLMASETSANVAFGASKVGVYTFGTSYRVVENGVADITPLVGSVNVSPTAANGHRWRLVRSGSAWSAWVSTDSGSSWAKIHDFATTTSAQVWPGISTNNTAAIGLITGSGLV